MSYAGPTLLAICGGISSPWSGLRLDAIELVLDDAAAWAADRGDVRGLCLVGSYVRGSHGGASDVDLILLSTSPSEYVHSDGWVTAFEGFSPVGTGTRQWGAITERRLARSDGLELDIGIAEPGWAAASTVDPGTRRVVEGGCRILHDPDRILARLLAATAAS